MNLPSALALERDLVLLRLAAAEGVVGRDPEAADVVVVSDLVSRKHARWRRTGDGGVDVADLDSRNGTFVDGARIGHEWVRLEVGQAVDFGRAGAFRLVREQPPRSTAASLPLSYRFRPGAEGDYRLEAMSADRVVHTVEGMRATLLFALADGWRRDAVANDLERGWIPRDEVMRRIYGARAVARSAFNKLTHEARQWAMEHQLTGPMESRGRQIRFVALPGGTVFEGC